LGFRVGVFGLRGATGRYGCVISKLVIRYISWELIAPVIRLITFRADNISARALGLSGRRSRFAFEGMGFRVQGLRVSCLGMKVREVGSGFCGLGSRVRFFNFSFGD